MSSRRWSELFSFPAKRGRGAGEAGGGRASPPTSCGRRPLGHDAEAPRRLSRLAGEKKTTVVFALLLVAAAPAPADTLKAIDAERQARAIDQASDQARARQAAGEISKLRAQLLALGRDEAAGGRTIGGARSALTQLNLREAELKVRMGRNQQSLTHLLAALQMYSRDPPPPLLVDPRSAREAVRAAILIQAITPELEARARAFTQASEELKRVRRQAAEQSGTLFQAESAEADREAEIDDLIAQKQALEKQLYADADAAGADMQRLAAKARSLGELVTAVDVRPAATAPTVDANLPARFIAPVAGQLVHGFAAPGGAPDQAKGVVWSTSANAAVLAPAAGEVEYAGPLKGWGQVLILRAGATRLILAGLGEVGTEAGRMVAAGEPVGKMPGDTERPTLYLEVRQASRPVDPARWLPEARAG